MKTYYASQDELCIDKGQQVWPIKEAIEMASKDGLPHDAFKVFDDKLFWGNYNGKWIFVNNENVPICKEVEGEKGK